MKARISELSTYVPNRKVDNHELTELVNQQQKWIPNGMIEHIFGIQERRFAATEEQVSDLATNAARPIVDKVGRENIDYLIFAAACSDLIEPATSNIVQYKLDLNCPVMDLKNACNSFVSAVHTASALITSGFYKNILIVTGEKLSDSIRFDYEDKNQFRKSAAGLSFGDAGAAALVSACEDGAGIFFQKFKTVGKYWDLCTIKGGGSMFPHDVSKNYFEGQTAALKDVILVESRQFIQQCFKDANCSPDEIDWLFTHQVSADTFRIVSESTGVPLEKCISVFQKYGNTAAASIPLSICQAIRDKKLKRGDKILIIGMAAGVSISFQLLNW